MYNWQHPDWPNFSFSDQLRDHAEAIVSDLMIFVAETNRLPEEELADIHLETTITEGYHSSAIEDEHLRFEDLRSSLLNNIRRGGRARPVYDRRAVAVANLLSAAAQSFNLTVSEPMLLHWHELLFADLPYPGTPGTYRSQPQPMRIVSGPDYNQTVHYVAPPAISVPGMMKTFIEQQTSIQAPHLIRAGLGHLHFESIHPFADGNGRIGRALLDKELLSLTGGQTAFSISYAIHRTQNEYYAALNASQGSLDASEWLIYFLDTVTLAIDLSRELLEFTLNKLAYFQRYSALLDSAQTKALRRMWAAGPDGFQGGMTAKKYHRLTRVSPATATRDLRRLTELGALVRRGAGRSTHYVLPSQESEE